MTQAYRPAKEAPTALFENRVTVTNKSSETINDIRYTRAMDWDVPPNPFNEYVTIVGRESATNVLYSSNDGFSTVNPLEPKTYTSYYQSTSDGDYVEKGAETVNADFVDAGPGDHGAVFDLGFGDLASGSSKTFSIYYGATTSEATALGALANVGAEMYSLGQSSPSGSPGTFIFGFKGVGGEPITVDQPLDPVADIPITDGKTSAQNKHLVVKFGEKLFRLLNTGARRVIKRPGTAGAKAVQLTNAQAARIRTIDEIAHNWKVRKTLSGELLDAGHIRKLEEGISGLEKARNALQISLQNPNLNQATRKAIQLRIDTANSLINRANELLGR